MSTALLLQALDLVLISLLVGGIYWPRHRRRDLVVAYIGVNVGVLAVAAVLANSSVTAGLGLGLFGVLSIIRLRSDELSQGEIAYYFASLALALVAGIAVTPVWLSVAFMLLIVAALAVVDSPALMSRHRRTDLVVDRALLDEQELRAHLTALLDAQILSVTVHRIDQVRDTTEVTVRHLEPRGAQDARSADPAARPDTRPEASSGRPEGSSAALAPSTAPSDALLPAGADGGPARSTSTPTAQIALLGSGRGGSHARH